MCLLGVSSAGSNWLIDMCRSCVVQYYFKKGRVRRRAYSHVTETQFGMAHSVEVTHGRNSQ